MMKNFIYLLLGLFIFSTSSVLAEGVEKPVLITQEFHSGGVARMSADDVARLAILKSLDIKISELDYKARRTDIMETQSRYDTNLTADASYDWEEEQQKTIVLGDRSITSIVDFELAKKTPIGLEVNVFHGNQRDSDNSLFSSVRSAYRSQTGIGLRQPLLRNAFGFIDRSEVKQVKIDVSSFKEEVLDEIEGIVFEARGFYWDYVRQLKLLEAWERAYDNARKFYDIVEKQLDTGLSELPDFYAAEANLRSRIQDILEARLLARIALNELKLTLSYYDDIVPAEDLEFDDSDISFDDMLDYALKHRRDYRQQLMDIEVRGIQVKINKMELLPDLDAVGEYKTNGFAEHFWPSEEKAFGFAYPRYFIGFELEYPLENSEARSQKKKADVELNKAKLELTRLAQQVQLEVEDTYEEWLTNREKVKQAIKIEDLQSKKLKEEDKQFRVGRSSSKIIIDYQDDFLEAERNKIDEYIEYQKNQDQILRVQNRLLDALGLTVELGS